MTDIRRPIHLQLTPSSIPLAPTCSPKALSPTGDSLPSQILPNLFVGNQEQTNRDTLNRLNISYILSLGLLPLITTTTPTSPTTTTTILMPSQNSSIDFKIRLKSSQESSNHLHHHHHHNHPHHHHLHNHHLHLHSQRKSLDRDENKGVKVVRSIHCKCINIADNSNQSLTKFFDEAHHFIDEARRKKCNILVHCLAGISRSPTIAIAYLMKVNSLRLHDAYNLVKQCRPQIDPNLSFMGELIKYEKSLEERGNNTKSADIINKLSS